MKGVTISVTDENVFLDNLKKPFFIPQNITSFDTSILKTEDIANEVIKIIENLN